MNNIDYQKIFLEITAELEGIDDVGEVASYIPELGKVDPSKLGIHLMTVDKTGYSLGDSNEKFSIQSIAKVLSLTLALKIMGKDMWCRVESLPNKVDAYLNQKVGNTCQEYSAQNESLNTL